jgi:hypothetical protein
MGSSTPASASTSVTLIGDGEAGVVVQEFSCALGNHATAATEPIIQVDNGCKNRVWLHQWSNGTGWSYCVTGNAIRNIPAKYQDATQAQVNASTGTCLS